MTFKLLETVVLLRDLPEHGLRAGDLGAVVLVHDERAYEVEFTRASGETQAVVTLEAGMLRSVQPDDHLSVRRSSGSR